MRFGNKMKKADKSHIVFSLQAKFYSILAKIQERSGSLEAALRTLSDAKDIRARLLKRVQLEQPDAASEQVNTLKHSNVVSKWLLIAKLFTAGFFRPRQKNLVYKNSNLKEKTQNLVSAYMVKITAENKGNDL